MLRLKKNKQTNKQQQQKKHIVAWRSLNHEKWDLMDLQVELTCTCSIANLKLFPEKLNYHSARLSEKNLGASWPQVFVYTILFQVKVKR